MLAAARLRGKNRSLPGAVIIAILLFVCASAGLPAGTPDGPALAHAGITDHPALAHAGTDSGIVRIKTSACIRGSGWSLWGEIPAPADSVAAAFVQPRRPLWETALLVPYDIVILPLWFLKVVAKGSIIFLDESGMAYRIGQLLGPQKGPFGIALRLRAGGLSGFGVGLTATHNSFFRRSSQFKLRWHSTSKGSHKVSMGIHFSREKRTQLILGAGYRLRLNARYYGLGPETLEDQESIYTQEVSWAGLSLRRIILPEVVADAMVLYSAVGARGPGDKGDTSIDERFGGKPFGYCERSDGVTLALSFMHDTTTDDGRPQEGNIQRFKVSRFLEVSDITQELESGDQRIAATLIAFWTFRVEMEQFVPLWFTNRALAVRGHATWIQPDEEDYLPFQRLLTNDDPDLLRGYRDFRWRDRGITALSIEYRWPIWCNKTSDGLGVDAYLLSDFGQVFAAWDEISMDNLTVSYGCGLRLIESGGFRSRLEVAWSKEETVFRLQSEQIFQFAKGGLLHGRDQVALR